MAVASATLARNNPFRTERLDRLVFHPQGESWETLETRLSGFGWRGAVVGPRGSGKTALLQTLAQRLAARGWRVLPMRARPGDSRRLLRELAARLPAPAPRDFVLLDSAEQIGPLAWRLVRRRCGRAGGLVIATHRPGRLPTLHVCRTSPALLARLACELLDDPATLDSAMLQSLYHRHHGNLRLALLALYDQSAGRESY